MYEGEQQAAINHEYYRRFEMAVSNFKFAFYDYTYMLLPYHFPILCKKDLHSCNLTSRVTFNHITEEREINIYEEYNSEVGIHLFHTEVWEEPANVNSVFSSQNILKLELVLHSIHHELGSTILNKTFKNIFKLFPKTEKKIWIDFTKTQDFFVSKNRMNTFGIYVSYRCQGYAGINCEFDCIKSNNNVECQIDNDTKSCFEQDGDKSNCRQNLRCTKDENICRNDAICVKVQKILHNSIN
ncbi:hypothetical protein RF11_06373 [Thelohanellus kitauei]|uniref:Uncharacterized protein n=1 Tax=Thelohanellus kitauei TaxID=669202 RepID=A0A0C2IJ89_THEKT|nr:hypothetical protein RF11_06373 [Thelohanellus kitauei]